MTVGTNQLLTLDKQDLDKLQSENNETINDLEDSIKLLKQQINQFGPEALPSPSTIVHRYDGTYNLKDVKERLQQDIKKLSHRLEETTKLTDISIEKVQRKVSKIDGNYCKKKFFVEMKIFNRSVHVDYHLEERMTSSDDESPACIIPWFEFKYGEDLNSAIGDLVNEAANNHAFHGVFDLLRSYLYRKSYLTDFVEENPDIVSIKHDESQLDLITMRISNPDPRHPVFYIDWRLNALNPKMEGNLSLRVEASESLQKKDASGVLREAPTVFTTMLNDVGTKTAIQTLIDLVREEQISTDNTSDKIN